MPKKPSHASTTPRAVLYVSPRTAKMMVVTPTPFGVQRVNAGTLPGETDDPVAALRALLEVQPLPVREVGLLFGREMFSLRTLELPSREPKEIASMLELQLGKLTPYARSEIVFSWTVVGSFKDGYTTLLLAIARKPLVEGVLQFLKSKGLNPLWAGVSSEGLEAWAAGRLKPLSVGEGQLLAVIDVDYASTDCAILSPEGKLLFTHSISIGHDQLQGSEPALLRLMADLIRLPRILVHEGVKGTIGRGVVTGVVVQGERIIEQLANQWGADLQIIDPLEGVAPVEVRERAKLTRTSYTALVGLLSAARAPRLDLMPPEARVTQALQVRSRHLARLAATVAVILMLGIVLFVERLLLLGHYQAQLEQRLSALGEGPQQVLQRQHLMTAIRRWLDPARSPLEIFRGIAAAASSDITLTQVSLAEGKPVVIRGRTNTMANAFTFSERLKKEIAFAGVDVRPVLKQRGGSSSAMGVEFEMVCALKAS